MKMYIYENVTGVRFSENQEGGTIFVFWGGHGEGSYVGALGM